VAERREAAPAAPSGPLSSLRADCEHCFGLCCVVPTFSVSADFAIDKPAGQPCLHLRSDFRCSIHNDLRTRGFPGCAVYDCFGAGQQVAQVTFGGQDWQRSPEVAEEMFAAFGIMRDLHELLWYLTEALTMAPAHELHGDLRRALHEIKRLTYGAPKTLAAVEPDVHQQSIRVLLIRASALVRADVAREETDFAGADLVGKDIRGADLHGASFRGACLIGADLRDADLSLADLLGADLRGADLRAADAASSIFLTQFQVNAARGDSTTRLPASLTRPTHWSARSSA